MLSCGNPQVGEADTAPLSGVNGVLGDAVQSGIGGAESADGGFVIFGVLKPDGRVSLEGAVIAPDAAVVGTFELPARLAGAASTMIDDDLFVVGTRCDDAPEVDDLGELRCSPGTVEAYRIDTTTGSSLRLDLPKGFQENVVPGSWTLFRAGRTPYPGCCRFVLVVVVVIVAVSGSGYGFAGGYPLGLLTRGWGESADVVDHGN